MARPPPAQRASRPSWNRAVARRMCVGRCIHKWTRSSSAGAPPMSQGCRGSLLTCPLAPSFPNSLFRGSLARVSRWHSPIQTTPRALGAHILRGHRAQPRRATIVAPTADPQHSRRGPGAPGGPGTQREPPGAPWRVAGGARILMERLYYMYRETGLSLVGRVHDILSLCAAVVPGVVRRAFVVVRIIESRGCSVGGA